MSLTVPYRIANGVGNKPDADQLLGNYDFITALTAGNYLLNPGLENWNGGTSFTNPATLSTLADSWTMTKSGTSSPSVNVDRESTTIDTGTYSMKLNVTGAGSSNSLFVVKQSIGTPIRFKTETVLFGMRVKASNANKVRLKLTDGTTVANSSYHAGDGNWALLQVAMVVGSTPSELTCSLTLDPADFTASVYADSAYLYVIPASMLPEAYAQLPFIPFQAVPDYLPTTGGTMTGNLNMGQQDITNCDDITCDSLIANSLQGSFFGMGRNRMVNGEMAIDQVNGGADKTVNSGSAGYSVDQWIGYGVAASGVYVLARDSSGPTGFGFSLRATCSTADASIAAGDSYLLQCPIEGYRVRDFLFGGASAKTITLSFWAKSSLTGIFTGSIMNSTSNRSYTFEYTISVASTWEFKTITVVGDTSGTWSLNTSGIGIMLSFALAIGSTYQQAAGTWGTGQVFGTSNQVNFMSSNSSRTWAITGIQLEIGTAATPFEYRPFPFELMLCQRYYEKSYDLDTVPGAATPIGGHAGPGAVTNTNTLRYGPIYMKVTKRATPTISIWDAAGTSNKILTTNTTDVNTARTADVVTVYTTSFGVRQAVTSADGYCQTAQWVADARL